LGVQTETRFTVNVKEDECEISVDSISRAFDSVKFCVTGWPVVGFASGLESSSDRILLQGAGINVNFKKKGVRPDVSVNLDALFNGQT
jgi:hypothetical protein